MIFLVNFKPFFFQVKIELNEALRRQNGLLIDFERLDLKNQNKKLKWKLYKRMRSKVKFG